MNKLILISSTLLLIFAGLTLTAQPISDKFKPQPKFLNFENTRISAGLNISFGPARFAEKPENLTGGFVGAGGLTLDIYMPLSVTGISTGVNYKLISNKFGLEPGMSTDSITSGWVEIPFQLRFKTGSIAKPSRMVFMPGIAYSIPLQVNAEGPQTGVVDDKEMLKPFIDYRLQIGWETLLGATPVTLSTGEVVDSPARMLIYLGASYSNPYYNPTFEGFSSPMVGSFDELGSKNGLNYYLGVTLFYQLSGWADLGSSILQAR